MTNKTVTMSRERRPVCHACVSRPRDEHCTICDIAAPIVERQPVATVRGVVSRKSSVFDIVIHDNQALHPGTKLYASPPAPVSVVLPEPVAEVVATGGPHDQEDRVLVELQAELPPIGTKLYAASVKLKL